MNDINLERDFRHGWGGSTLRKWNNQPIDCLCYRCDNKESNAEERPDACRDYVVRVGLRVRLFTCYLAFGKTTKTKTLQIYIAVIHLCQLSTFGHKIFRGYQQMIILSNFHISPMSHLGFHLIQTAIARYSDVSLCHAIAAFYKFGSQLTTNNEEALL